MVEFLSLKVYPLTIMFIARYFRHTSIMCLIFLKNMIYYHFTRMSLIFLLELIHTWHFTGMLFVSVKLPEVLSRMDMSENKLGVLLKLTGQFLM